MMELKYHTIMPDPLKLFQLYLSYSFFVKIPIINSELKDIWVNPYKMNIVLIACHAFM